MAEVEKREGGPSEKEEEERLLMEDVTVLDFDMLCSTVAMQAQKGKWGKLNAEDDDEDENYQYGGGGGGVFRMWEGELVYDCLDDRRIALQSTCCPCYRFGRNMKRAAFGSCLIQGFVHLILAVIALSNLVAFIFSGRHCFLYLGIAFIISLGTYVGYYRTQMRKRFNIKDSDSSFDDCVYHLICPCCTLCQESRTLEMNNVEDGIWHGRGDTICIGSFSEESKAIMELAPPFVVSTKSPESLSMQKTTTTSVIGNSSSLV